MNPLMNPVGSNAEGKLNCINAVVITHNRTPILIQSVSGLVSVFFIRKSLFNGIYRYNLTKEGSAVTEKLSPQSLFYFLPLYYLTKGREGVHFRQRGVHILIIPKINKKPQKADL